MFQHVPNLLTGLRLVLAVAFFAILSWYQYEGRGDPTLLNIAFGVYVVALVTDFLDGYLARRWNVEGTFGRVIDPLVDKVLVLGGFIFFAGKNFIIPETVHTEAGVKMVVRTITGITPTMVVVILVRELLVTSLRGISESGGHKFGAVLSGKLKMVLQSVTILLILMYVNYFDWLAAHRYQVAATWVRDIFIWVMLLVTVASGVQYIHRAMRLYWGRSEAALEEPAQLTR